MFEHVKRDLARYRIAEDGALAGFLSHGLWASAGYRFGAWVRVSSLPGIVRRPLWWLAILLKTAVQTLTNIDLDLAAEVGPGVMIAHTGYIVVGHGTVLGENVTLTPGVVLGHGLGGRSGAAGSPRVGDRVYLGPGAKLVGPIEIGHDAVVGAGSVVIRDVPARAVVAGNPARQVSAGGSFELVKYPGMDHDAARQASLAAGEREVGEASSGG